MKIAEVSKRYGLSADTLRYYERVGLLSQVARTKSGVRDYAEQDCARIQFVKCMRSAGMSVESLVRYMNLLDEGESTVPARIALLEEQRDLMAARVAEMEEGLARLNRKIANYEECLGKAERELTAKR